MSRNWWKPHPSAESRRRSSTLPRAKRSFLPLRQPKPRELTLSISSRLRSSLSTYGHSRPRRRTALAGNLPMAGTAEEGGMIGYGPRFVGVFRQHARLLPACCAAQDHRRFRSNGPPPLNWWTTSRPPKPLATKFPPASCCEPTSWSNRRAHVCFWHVADIPAAPSHVRYWGYSGHRYLGPLCPLMTQSGHLLAARSSSKMLI